MTIRYFDETRQHYDAPRTTGQALIHIPSQYLGSRTGGYRHLTKTVHIHGTVEAKFANWSSRERVEYGWIEHARKQYTVLYRGPEWHVIGEK